MFYEKRGGPNWISGQKGVVSKNAHRKPSSHSKASGSGSDYNGAKKSSRLNKGASKADADSELSKWGMERSHDGEQIYGPPSTFEWNGKVNDLYRRVDGPWDQHEINPDSTHKAKYGEGPVYLYQTNIGAGAFHTDFVFTDVEPETNQERKLPTSRRALTYNAWIEAGGDPAKLRILSDENIVNKNAKKCYELTIPNGRRTGLTNEGPRHSFCLDWRPWLTIT